VSNDGRLFHARAAATGKARSPIVLQRVTGTTTVVDQLERRLHLVVTSVAPLMLSALLLSLPTAAYLGQLLQGCPTPLLNVI